jgi:uncharacterized membrane protein YheB (UPF0754 family)
MIISGMQIETYLTYLTIPAISAVVGLVTNWLAVKMTFYPVEYRGIRPFGWQGIIPANAKKMAKIAVDMSIRKLITLDELVDRIDPDEMIEATGKRLDEILEKVVDELMLEYEPQVMGRVRIPNVWHLMPRGQKNRVYAEVRKEVPNVVRDLVNDMKYNLNDLVDLNEITIEKLSQEKGLLNDIFLLAAKSEFDFLIRSGIYFGFPMGLPVMALWYYFPTWWLLPLFGAIVGGVTNKLAMYLIAKPLYPIKFGPFTILGLFIKRQKEVSKIYGEVYAKHLVNSEALFEALMRSESSDRLFAILERNINLAMERTQGNLKPVMMLAIGSQDYHHLRDRVCDSLFKELTDNTPREVFEYTDKALDIENTLGEKIGNMSPDDFYSLLRPAVEQDEWKVVAVGTALGCVAGYLQWITLT